MTEWVPDLEKSEGFRYRALAEAIRSAIQTGALKPGEMLLAHREMAWKLGLSIATVARAYQIAAEWGLLSSRVGHGTRVRELGDERRLLTVREDPPHLINFGLLRATSLDESALRKAAFVTTLSNVGKRVSQQSLSGYAPDLGYKAHRELGAAWINSLGENCVGDDVIITRGVQEAFLLILTILSQQGDPVLVEEINYLGLAHLLRLRHHQMIAVPMDEDGMSSEHLQHRVKNSGARLLFISPTLQNPTGTTMSIERRRTIVEIARRNDLFIVEDDAFSALASETRPPSIASLAPERTFHLISLSKFTAPAMRVCFMRCPAGYVDTLEAVKHALTLGGPFLQAEIATEWIRTGLLKKLCNWQIAEIRRRWALACEALGDLMPRGVQPAPFVFVQLPESWRAGAFVNAAHLALVTCIEADRFTLGRAAAPQAVRLSLSSPLTDEEYRVGLKRISDLLSSSYLPSRPVPY